MAPAGLTPPAARTAIYVGGRWLDRPHGARLPVTNPTSEEVFAEVVEATPDDVAAAVAAADGARETWSALGFARRAAALRAIAAGLLARRQELIEIIIAEVGTPRRAAETMQVDVAIDVFRDMAGFAESLESEAQVRNSAVARVPMGVAGLITPWNYPLYQIALKVAPALAAGCPVVLKPSDIAPLNAFLLAEVMDAAALPAGVFNLVPGRGASTGEAIVRDPRVSMVSFTGSVRTGRRIGALAAEGIKKVALELGGKGATLVAEDGDLDAATRNAVRSCFANAGQTCAALTRLIVPRRHLARAEELARSIAAAYVLGDPQDAATQLGPVISSPQRARVARLVETAMAEGARQILGAADRHLPNRGYFVAPTILSGITPAMTVAQEEVFGPVLSIMPADSDDDAVSIANATRYGLTAAVWAADAQRARALANRIRAGSVTLNGGAFNPLAPFGGVKESGFGRERGSYGLDEYLTFKAFHG
jgi:aldehyde dehydrogenase (NAD+)